MAQSRYAPLVKLKKKGLDEAERNLTYSNAEVEGAQKALEMAYGALEETSIPTSGLVSELRQGHIYLESRYHDIENCKIRLAEAIQQQAINREIFKKAMMEYEKFNYLDVQEIEKKIAKIKSDEQKFLDDIGTMTYKGDMK